MYACQAVVQCVNMCIVLARTAVHCVTVSQIVYNVVTHIIVYACVLLVPGMPKSTCRCCTHILYHMHVNYATFWSHVSYLEKRALYIRISNAPHVTALCVVGFVSNDMYDWYDLGMDRIVWVSACTAAICDIVWQGDPMLWFDLCTCLEYTYHSFVDYVSMCVCGCVGCAWLWCAKSLCA